MHRDKGTVVQTQSHSDGSKAMLMRHDFSTLKVEMLETVLDALSVGVVLAARDGHVVHMNASAASQIKNGAALCLLRNKLRPIDPAAARALAAALAEVCDHASKARAAGKTVAFPERRGVGLLATVLPVARVGACRFSDPFAARAAIFIQDPGVLPLRPGDAFAKLYGLTPSELRVAQALMASMTLQDVAAGLKVSLQTVRTHLQHIFQKTGTSRQADFLALMWRSAGPILM